VSTLNIIARSFLVTVSIKCYTDAFIVLWLNELFPQLVGFVVNYSMQTVNISVGTRMQTYKTDQSQYLIDSHEVTIHSEFIINKKTKRPDKEDLY